MFEVRVNGLRFQGSHGVFESERAQGTAFSLSLTALVTGDADKSDRLEDTVDYSKLAATALAINESRSFMTVEALAGSIASAILGSFNQVRSVEIVLDKLSPAGMPDVESCGVRLRMERE